MSELRKDPVLGRWVAIAAERGKRPSDFKIRVSAKKGGFCAFCSGNEYTTPPEIIAFRAEHSKPDSPGWTLRVVPNKFPALGVDMQLNRVEQGVFEKTLGVGAHEIIIESPDHQITFSTLPLKYVEDTLNAFCRRIADLKKDKRLKYILIFKSEGDTAGASLEHSHSQLMALPIVPKLIQEELNNAKNYHDLTKHCIFCDIIQQETAEGIRVISENEHFISIAPFASTSPFETWILPKNHESSLVPDAKISPLAQLLQKTFKQIDSILSLPPYNMIIHLSPLDNDNNEYYHWHIEIRPQLIKTGGFEWGSGFYINPTAPEEAAQFMRDAPI
jgi:UDPglucose--hexose-1-phosphate uridylyltransferase